MLKLFLSFDLKYFDLTFFKEFFLKAYLCCTIFTKEVEPYTAIP